MAACSTSAVSLRTTIPSVNLRGADERGNALSVSVCDARDAMWYFSIILKMILIAASVAENARKEGRTSFGPCALTEGGRGLHQPCLPRNFGKNMKRHYGRHHRPHYIADAERRSRGGESYEWQGRVWLWPVRGDSAQYLM